MQFIMGHFLYVIKFAYDSNKLPDLKNFMIKTGKWQSALEDLSDI